MKSNSKRDLVADWVRKAEGDFLTASRELSFADPVTDTVCFHCQQAVEKYLKAYLIHLDAEFPYTHELGDLVALVAQLDPAVGEFAEAADALTDYAVEVRYPVDSAVPSTTEAKIAF
jgi:HEPN domain-containing protein